MSELSVSLVQMQIEWHDPQANRQRIQQICESSGYAPKSDLLVLPEMFTTGFSMEAAKFAETMEGPSVQWMRSLSVRYNTVTTGSVIIQEGDKYFNRLIWMPPTGQPQWYDKRHPFSIVGEDRIYSAGTGQTEFVLGEWRIRASICYDLRFPVWLRQQQPHYDLLLCVANWPDPRHNAWTTLLQARAMENLSYVVGVNRTGTDPKGNRYAGSSLILDAKGMPLADAQDQEQLVNATLSKTMLDEFRKKFPVHRDADRFELRQS